MESYAGVDRYAMQAFKGCHDRVRDGKCPSISWPRNRQGYIDFCKDLGPKPDGMEKPSVGRINHQKGYFPGNIRWEEHRLNSVKRRGTRFELFEGAEPKLKTLKFKKGTPEHREHQRKASKSRWDKHRERNRNASISN